MARTTLTGLALPGFVVDQHSVDLNSGRQMDWSKVGEAFRSTPGGIVTVNGAHALGAVALTVQPLPVAVPSGTTLDFGTGGEFARTTAAAAAGATSIPVTALPEALEGGEVATVKGSGDKVVPAGTVMVELASGKMIPRVDRTGAETSIGLLAASAVENSKTDALTGYGVIVGGVIYQNMLPEGVPAAGVKAELNAAGVGGFIWETYADNRGS